MTYLPSFTTNKSKVFHLTTLSLALALAGCGGGGDTVDSIAPKPDIGVITTPSTGSASTIDDVDIYISFANNELKTGSDKTTAQIRVTDKNGGILSGMPVELSIEDASKYGLSLSGASKQTTDANGMVEVDIVQSSGNNLDAQIDHKTQFKVVVPLEGKEDVEQSTPIVVTGTQVENASASVGVLGAADNVRIEGVIVDGSSQPLKNATVVLYNNGKEIDNTGKTDNQGKFVFDTNSSLLTAVNDSYMFSVVVQGSEDVSQHISNILEIPSTSSVSISFPKIPDILVKARRKVVVNVPNAKNGDIVTISTNKGKIYTGTYNQVGSDGSLSQQFKVSNKQIVFYIRSEAPASATITARYGQDTRETNVYFVSTEPSKLLLQVEKAVLATGQTTPVIARVLDSNDAPVKNAIVQFSVLKDASGGKLSKGLAFTDENGLAMVEYTAGRNPTGADGVRIQSEVKAVRLPSGKEEIVNTLVDSKPLTVSTRSSYVSVALADKVSSSSNEIYYIRQGSIMVLDNVGQPAANQKVTLSLIPNDYERGYFEVKNVSVPAPTSGDNKDDSNSTANTASPEKVWVKTSVRCDNEDKNKNGILDKGEDINRNGKLDPVNTATILQSGQEVATTTSESNGAKQVSFTTDNTGKVDFAIRYPKQFAQWFDAIITVNTRVDGSESQTSRSISFPVLVSDINIGEGIRPNSRSPFGTTLSCTAP